MGHPGGESAYQGSARRASDLDEDSGPELSFGAAVKIHAIFQAVLSRFRWRNRLLRMRRRLRIVLGLERAMSMLLS